MKVHRAEEKPDKPMKPTMNPMKVQHESKTKPEDKFMVYDLRDGDLDLIY